MLALIACVSTLPFTQASGPRTFSLSDPKGVNRIQWFIDSPLEPIAGSATGITGEILFDPAKPAATRGRVVVPVAKMEAPVALMSEHLREERWLDGARFPEIVLEITGVRVKRVKPRYEGTVTGSLTIRGVTRRVSAPVIALYTPGGAKERMGGRGEGDLLTLRTDLKIRRSDFGIGPAMFRSVGDEIELRVGLAAFAKP